MDYYFTRDDEYLTTCPENLTFRELHYCSEKKFEKWVDDVSQRIRSRWYQHQVPVLPGNSTTQNIVEDMKKLSGADTDRLLVVDDLTHRNDCIVSWGKEGLSVNNFFPSLWLTVDASVGASLYQTLTGEKKRTSRNKGFRRHFRRDGFYVYSVFAKRNDTRFGVNTKGKTATTGLDWIQNFEEIKKTIPQYKHYDYWFEYHLTPQGKHKGNRPNKLTVNKTQLDMLLKRGTIKKKHIRAIERRDSQGNLTHKYKDLKDTDRFYIRVFDGKEKIFSPKTSKIFRMGFSVLSATNFPPTVAKYIYKKYTERIKEQKRIVIYDPSAGWGGRLIAACASGSDRNIHYVGTDPNWSNYISALHISRYEYLAQFYQRNVPQEKHITYEIFQEGSEEIHKVSRFHKYKGKIDLVFTSPPYFDAEGYSTDYRQSSVKFPEYDLWREGFLQKTLETCCRYLKVGGYLIWNIADVKKGTSMLPLESDTVEILTDLGMKYEEKIKFVLSIAPGGGRVSWVHRNPQTKNFVSVGGKYRKYEPIFVFRKTRKSV